MGIYGCPDYINNQVIILGQMINDGFIRFLRPETQDNFLRAI
jgi:hypothetical protein